MGEKTIAEPSPEPGFHQKAARNSWKLPLFALLISVVIQVMVSGPGSPPWVGLLFGLIFLAAILTGFVAGIIGCYGVKKYGAKTTLVPGLIGIALSGGILALMISIAIPSFHAARKAAQDKRLELMRREIVEVNRGFPKVIDEVTRLDRVEVHSLTELEYFYSVLEGGKEDFDEVLFQKQMRPLLEETYKTAPEFEVMRDQGIRVRFTYRDRDGERIASVRVPE